MNSETMSMDASADAGGEPSNSRRSFLSNSLIAGAGIAAAGLLSPRVSRAVTPALTFADIPGTGDVKVLNYALALEDLEADLYAQAIMRLTEGGTNKLGTKITGLKLDSDSIDVQYLQEFALVEAEHRDFLTAALGKSALPLFKYNFKMETLHREQVLNLVYTAEKTGVSAYLGAFPFFATRSYVQIASAIQGTEARHTAVVAILLNILYNEGLTTAPLADPFPGASNGGKDSPLTPDEVLAAVSGFIVT